MNKWRQKAIEFLPDHRNLIQNAENPFSLWIEITEIFDNAYKTDDRETIKNIYSYARWCISNGHHGKYLTDAGSAAVTAFYEHIPTNTKARNEMHLFFSKNEFLNSQSVFSYLLEKDDFESFKKDFLYKKDNMKP